MFKVTDYIPEMDKLSDFQIWMNEHYPETNNKGYTIEDMENAFNANKGHPHHEPSL